HVRSRKIELGYFPVECSMANHHDEDDIVWLGCFCKRRERLLDLLLRRLTGGALWIFVRLLGEIDDVVFRNAEPICCPVDEGRRPSLKQFRMFRIAGQSDNHCEVDSLRRGWRCECQEEEEHE